MGPWLLIMCGYPFSGKSTLAHAIAERLGMDLVAVDDQHESPGATTGSADLNDRDGLRAYRAAYEQIEWRLAAGRSVVFDSVGFRRRDRDRARRMADRAGAQAAVIWLDVSIEEARARLERNAANPVRPGVPVERFAQISNQFEPPREDERVFSYRSDIDPATWVEHVLLPEIQ